MIRLVLLGCCAACVTKVDPFTCQTSAQCAGGTCEPTGFCSVADGACPTGRRYVKEAGPLAGQCVGGAAGDGGGGIDTVPGECGDAMVNTGEDCDDGNQNDDDGCISCVFARCGDGTVRSVVEQCDDENPDDTDGCTSTCLSCEGDDALGRDGHCYRRVTTGATWSAAYDACAGEGGHLVIYESLEESMAVGAWLPSGNLHWTGLRDLSTEGVYRWDYLALDPAQDQWASGEPAGAGNDDCVAQSGGTGLWDQIACNVSHDYVCEFEPWLVRPGSSHAYRFTALELLPATWSFALSQCTGKGAHLATITDAEEQTFVEGHVVGTPSWIGAQDMSTEGTWVWPTGEPFTFTNWAAGEPDDLGGADCVALTTGGTWQDDPCGDRAARICEVE